MGTLKLSSCLATQIQSFIDLRRLSGTDYNGQAQLLGYFDRFLVEQELGKPRITREIIDKYQRSLDRLAPRTRGNRFCVVRQLCEYLARADPLTYVPEPQRLVPSHAAHQPYIYSQDEIQALMTAASQMRPSNSLRPHTYRTLLGLLYTTGIRIGEAFALNLESFDKDEQRLYIAAGKFRKARWVPLSSSTYRALESYTDRRQRSRPQSPDSSLFLNRRSNRMCHSTVNQAFHKLLRQCRVAHNKSAGPRIHDLRHTFAVHRLLAWYREGGDVNARLPELATYMGHVSVSSTHVYLRPTAELLEEVNNRFHEHYLHNVNPNGAE
jgi:site-specific recombinase XerD